MKTFLIVDTANMFMRSRHVVRGDLNTQLGMAMHIMFASVRKCWRDTNADHVVFCLEGRSWRKDFYEPYKRNRKDTRDKKSANEQEEDAIFWEVFDEFGTFLKEKTNVTVMQNSVLEADDLIAGWVQAHPDDNHVIVSSDGDFAQLVSENTSQYNGIANTLTTINGYFDDEGRPILDKKTKQVKPAPDPEWLLFEKCMRGDTSDNVFSAYPGVRKKGTKNKVGLLEAFDDKGTKGYNWNNMMLQRWVDHEQKEHRVLDDYNRNVTLCDLTAQPEHIKVIIKQEVAENAKPKEVKQVGLLLMKFCAKWDLRRMLDSIQTFTDAFSTGYPK